MYSLKILCGILEKRGIIDYPVHIKLDTGMHRLGFMTSELQELTDFLKVCKFVRVKSIFSHLAAAEDPASDDFTMGQIRMFEDNAGSITEAIGYRPMLHKIGRAHV